MSSYFVQIFHFLINENKKNKIKKSVRLKPVTALGCSTHKLLLSQITNTYKFHIRHQSDQSVFDR